MRSELVSWRLVRLVQHGRERTQGTQRDPAQGRSSREGSSVEREPLDEPLLRRRRRREHRRRRAPRPCARRRSRAAPLLQVRPSIQGSAAQPLGRGRDELVRTRDAYPVRSSCAAASHASMRRISRARAARRSSWFARRSCCRARSRRVGASQYGRSMRRTLDADTARSTSPTRAGPPFGRRDERVAKVVKPTRARARAPFMPQTPETTPSKHATRRSPGARDASIHRSAADRHDLECGAACHAGGHVRVPSLPSLRRLLQAG
jgi:hypothetical protein